MKLYLLDTIREVRRNSKENLPIDIGTSRIKVTVVKMLLFLSILCLVDIACKCRCNFSCSFLATDSWRDALADKAQSYLFP